jgi:phosphate transport system permease protein
MTDATAPAPLPASTRPTPRKGSLLVADSHTRKRNAAEKRFRIYGMIAVSLGVLALIGLLTSILMQGLPAFYQTKITIPVTLEQERVEAAEASLLKTSAYAEMLRGGLAQKIEEAGLVGAPDQLASQVEALISGEAPATLRRWVLANPERVAAGDTVEFQMLTGSRIDGYYKGRVTMESAEIDSNVTPEQLQLADRLKEAGILTTSFNWGFFTMPDASENRAEAAGLGVAILGSFYMMLVVLVLVLPIGVAASIYLEEFAPKNWITDIIEVNISNLAAVPSIVFGILGLAIFINFAGLPQSAPIVGGLVLTLMTLPTIIIATRASLKSVPPSIRDAALGVGASKMQSVFHHVLPLAAPGILTGTIIGLAQALGETAPLLLIGMVAFVREYPAGPPEGFFDPASALPVQVYNWTQRADPAFVERASGAIIVLLVFLLCMNALAILLRRRFERRW